MQNCIAKIKIKSLSQAALRKVWDEDRQTPLTQSHYHITGSLEEFFAKVRTAFYAWRGAQRDSDVRWGCMLGTLPGAVIFFTDPYYSDAGTSYFQLDFATGEDGAIQFADVPTQVDVQMVVKALGMEDTAGEAAEQTKLMANPTGGAVTQTDTVTSTPVINNAGAAGVLPTGPAVPAETDANGDASVTLPLAVATSSLAAGTGPGVAAGGGTLEGEGGAPIQGSGEAGPIVKASVIERKAENLIQGSAYDKHGDSLAYITEVKQSAGKSGVVQIAGIATKSNIVNKNKQVYPTSVWKANISQMDEFAKAGKFLGKVEHPEVEQGLKDAAIVFTGFELQGDEVHFTANIVPSDQGGGNHLSGLIVAGAQIDMSTRGYGTLKQGEFRGQKDVQIVQDDFVCTAIDAVWHGAAEGSRITTIQQSAATAATTPSTQKQGDGAATMNDNGTEQVTQSADDWAKALATKQTLDAARAELVSQSRSKLSEPGVVALQAALATCTTAAELKQAHDTIMAYLPLTFPAPTAEQKVQSSTYTPYSYRKLDQDERAPQTVGEMFDRMVADIPDHYVGQSIPANGEIPNHLTSPRRAMKTILANTARMNVSGHFNGRSAALGLLALEQGKVDVARDVLEQGLSTGATVSNGNADPGGAPTSNVYIFPLILRVYPQLILNEIASIQPLDRPEAKIFFLDHNRVGDPSGSTKKRLDLNTSANPFNSSWADDPGEGQSAKLINMELSSRSIEATTKKLQAQFTIEQAQDLNAYHGLDAAQVLLAGVSREMANEWNKTVLDDMLAQATGSALTFNKTAPAGFTQPEWNREIWTYVTKMSSDVFVHRNGGITHLVCGTDAALAISKGLKFAGADAQTGDIEMYPGLEIFPVGTAPNGSRYRILKTNFWSQGANASKILGIRKGREFFDTAYVFAPYADYLAPTLTDPDSFNQRLGIMSRAAKTVVVPEAMGYITVADGNGIPL